MILVSVKGSRSPHFLKMVPASVWHFHKQAWLSHAICWLITYLRRGLFALAFSLWPCAIVMLSRYQGFLRSCSLLPGGQLFIWDAQWINSAIKRHKDSTRENKRRDQSTNSGSLKEECSWANWGEADTPESACGGVFTKHSSTFPDEILCRRIILMKMSFLPPPYSLHPSVRPFSDKQLAGRPRASSPVILPVLLQLTESSLTSLSLHSQKDTKCNECFTVDFRKAELLRFKTNHNHTGKRLLQPPVSLFLLSSINLILLLFSASCSFPSLLWTSVL